MLLYNPTKYLSMSVQSSSYHLHSLAPYRISTPSRFVLTHIFPLPMQLVYTHFFVLPFRLKSAPVLASPRLVRSSLCHSFACHVKSALIISIASPFCPSGSKASPRPAHLFGALAVLFVYTHFFCSATPITSALRHV